MTKCFRIAVLGLAHEHVWANLEHLAGLGNAQLVGVADPNQELLERVRQTYRSETCQDYEQLVEHQRPDAVFIFADNARGAELAAWAAARGLHVMIEKPMAADLAGAERMIAAARQANVRLMVNWPVAWRPQVQAALALAARPEIGRIWQVTCRAGHAGPEAEGTPYSAAWVLDPRRNGGGALIDLCCYGANLANVLLGRPTRVTAVAGQLRDEMLPAEDTAMVVMSYPRAMATAEGSWNQVGQPVSGYLATIWGTSGTVVVGPGRGGRLWSITAAQPAPLEVTPPQPEPHMANGSAHFLWALSTGNEFYPFCRAETCRNTQEVLEAALLSARTGAGVELPLVAGRNK
jgi:predicted dehydrogenase